MVAVIPPHRHFDADAVLFADHVDRFRHDRGFGAVEVFNVFPDPTFVEQFGSQRFSGAFVFDDDPDAGVEKGQFAQAVFQRLELVFEVGKGAFGRVRLGGGQKAHLGAAHSGSGADRVDMCDAFAVFKAGAILGFIAPDGKLQPFRQGVDDRDAHAVQAARHFVSVAAVIGVVEFAAGVKLGHDDLGRGNALFLMDVDGDAATVVADRYAGIRVDFYRNGGGVACQRLINSVIHHLIDHVVETRPIVGVTDIHAGAFADGL